MSGFVCRYGMATRIKLKNSVVQDQAPTTADIQVGELALNCNSGSPGAYIQDSDGSIVKLAGEGSITTPDASETVKGIAEIATTAEVTTGTDDTKIVTPLKLAEVPAPNLQDVTTSGATTDVMIESSAGYNLSVLTSLP